MGRGTAQDVVAHELKERRRKSLTQSPGTVGEGSPMTSYIKPLLPQPVRIDIEQLNNEPKKWLQTLLEIPTPETNAAPVGPGTTFIAIVAASGQPIIKGFTGYFKADLTYQCMVLNLILAACRAVSALATGGTGTYNDMVHPENKEKEHITNTYNRMQEHVESQIFLPPLTETALNQFLSDSKPDSETRARMAASLESYQPPLHALTPSPLASLDGQPSTPRKPPRVDSTISDLSTSPGGSLGCQSPSLPTTASLDELNQLDVYPDTPTVGEGVADTTPSTETRESIPFSGTSKVEEKNAIENKLKQTLTEVLELNIGTGDWNFLFPKDRKDQSKEWFSKVTNYLLDQGNDVVFGEWEKFISRLITPFAWIGGTVFSCLSTYGVYTVFITALCSPFFVAAIAAAITFALSMIVAMTFYRNQISTAFLKFGQNLDGEKGFRGLFVWENAAPSLVALTSAITMPPLLFMSIHTPLMALALKIGITASILNPIAAIICATLVAITTIAAIGANHSQASKLWENMKKLWSLLWEQESFGGKALFCFAFAVALVISAATLTISVFGDVGGFRSLTDAGLALSVAFAAISLVANASFMIADTLYKTTLSIHESCQAIPAPSWPRFFSSLQANTQTESFDAKAALITPCAAPA